MDESERSAPMSLVIVEAADIKIQRQTSLLDQLWTDLGTAVLEKDPGHFFYVMCAAAFGSAAPTKVFSAQRVG